MSHLSPARSPPMLLLMALLQAPVRQITLTTPDRVLSESFSQVRGIRELGNGKVIIVDRLDRGLLAADLGTGEVTRIGKSGRGPGEYTLIAGLVPMAGDSTLAYDEGNGRFVLITPDLRIGRTFTLVLPGLGLPVGARGVDREGRYYLRIPAWMFQNNFRRDTLPIVRFDLARDRVDTLAYAKGSTARPAVEHRVMGVPYVIFAAEDGWAVAPDGRVAVVRSGDYHVEWYAPGRPVVRGPPVPFAPRRVTAADRLAYIKHFVENSATSGRD
ncbi:MAG TPA: 6-bladed beta-propeller, partial [Gemmatimonadales bacterium]|nr:6-bladed beta-propeller [Gemmatimonadales bacterium]